MQDDRPNRILRQSHLGLQFVLWVGLSSWLGLKADQRLGTSPAFTFEGNQTNAWLGSAAGPAGDVNADGFGDLIVGAPEWSNGQPQEGAAWVFHGGASGLSASAAWLKELNESGGGFVYAFSESEVQALAHEAGYSVPVLESHPFPHALLLPHER